MKRTVALNFTFRGRSWRSFRRQFEDGFYGYIRTDPSGRGGAFFHCSELLSSSSAEFSPGDRRRGLAGVLFFWFPWNSCVFCVHFCLWFLPSFAWQAEEENKFSFRTFRVCTKYFTRDLISHIIVSSLGDRRKFCIPISLWGLFFQYFEHLCERYLLWDRL